MNNLQQNPVKIYVQDIFRAKRTENKYIFEMFGITFKNIMIHGVVTSFHSSREETTNFELSDPTGCIQVYYDSTKSNEYVTKDTMTDLIKSFAAISRFHDENVLTMSSLLNSIECKYKEPLNFQEGSYVSVVGDIFTDQNGSRNVSAYSCKKTSLERDIIWMEELHYLYRQHYLKNSIGDSG